VSRHARQRNRRWRRTLSRADSGLVSYGFRVWQEHGKISTVLTPLERLVVEEKIKKEELRLAVLEAVRDGHMVMIPRGWRYLSPEALERKRCSTAPKPAKWVRVYGGQDVKRST
jgi:hypothetical protein